MRLIVLTAIIAPYRIPVFNALAATPGLDLRVVYLAETDPNRMWPVYRDEIAHDFLVLRDSLVMALGGSHVHLSRGLLKELVHWRPDVIVAGGWDQPAMLLAYSLRRALGYALAWWVESTERDRRGTLRFPKGLKSRLVRGADAVIVPGVASARYVASLGASSDKIAVAPNAVDTHFFASRANGDRGGRSGCCFIYVGRLHSLKGLDVLLDAWSLLNIPSATLTLVGDGPARPPLERRIARESLQSLRLTGHLDREALASAYWSSDVFVFPSLSDSWGLVLNEAMACALPLITTSAPGAVEDLVTDGWNGRVVDPENAPALAEAMRELGADRNLRILMGERSKAHIMGFSPERCAEGLAHGANIALRRAGALGCAG